MTPPDDARTVVRNPAPLNLSGEYVLYWMIAARRTRYSFALDRALAWARALDRPLLVYEPLRVGYPWASERHSQFILDGMPVQQARFDAAGVTYLSYVEPVAGAGKGMLAALAARAAVVVTDDNPTFHYPHMLAAAAEQCAVRVEAVDGNGLVPMRAAPQPYERAFSFRRYLQKVLPEHLKTTPAEDPLKDYAFGRALVAPEVLRCWPSAPRDASKLPVDHGVKACAKGGEDEGRARMNAFFKDRLKRYVTDRNDLDDGAASGLSPFLHFGQLSTHEIFAKLAAREKWTPAKLTAKATGKKDGWWAMSEPSEAFLDELVTWREVGFNYAALRADHDEYESLPEWVQKMLAKHAKDPRTPVYSLGDFERASTHDPLWNAAQRQLVRDGIIHNYLRMLWGKKILEWSASPQTALEVMIELNNKYALDGRDPNSYSGIFWVLGRYDRPWFPERPVLGTIRYMSSENTARKIKVKRYLARYSEGS